MGNVASAGQMAPVHVIRSLSEGSRHCRSSPTKQDGIITPDEQFTQKLSREHMQHNHLGAQRLGRLEHVQQLRVVDLQQHACDLPCQVGVHVLNQRKETLTCKGRERKTEGEKAVTTAQKQDFQIKLKFRNSPSICFCS